MRTTAELTSAFLDAREALVTRLVAEGQSTEAIAAIVNVDVRKPKAKKSTLGQIIYEFALDQLLGDDDEPPRKAPRP